jgi:molecular chaperone HscC
VIVGIDLGTTYSLVSVMRDDGPVVLPNALGDRLTPSAVSVLEDGSLVIGAAARARATTHPERTALVWKRDMGTDRVWRVADRSFTPPELSAMVLRSLKIDAEAALGPAVEEAVVTVPAYFDETQRRATRDAGAIAGLKVERIINEPTAAALAFGLHQRHRELRAVVFDLGGGTFDVTVLEIIEGVIEIQSTAGDSRLGGEDFAEALAAGVAGRLSVPPETLRAEPKSWARLLSASDEAKRMLTGADSTRIVLPDLSVDGKVRNVEITVTRAEAEALWAPLLDRLRAPAMRALRDAGLGPADVGEVLLVGGATRMPCVVRLASQIFDRVPDRRLPPDEAVALGAGIQAALKEGHAAVEDLVVTDVAPFTMGIAVGAEFGGRQISGMFAPILERGTVIPASRVQTFSTMSDNQTVLLVEVFQGEHASCEKNRKLGQYRIAGLPAGPAGKESIDVRFSYDLNGLLEVDMTILSTGRRETLVVEQTPGRMTDKQIAEARRSLERLKFHPREALPNTTALTRADALYVELVGQAREALGTAIARFRAALDTQDAKLIDETRAQMLAIIDHFTSAR